MSAPPARPPLEAGDPALEPRLFRRCLGQFATGIAIITARHGGERAGVTVNSFASVSLDPPLVLWSISRTSRSFPVFEASPAFAINLLAEDQIDVSRRFSGADSDKFAAGAWSEGLDGAPLLDGAVAQFECRREAAHAGGDHVILVGRVARFARFDGAPLLFVQGRYGVAEDHPDLAAAETVTERGGPAPGEADGDALLPLLFRAQHYLSASFDAHRRAEGVNLALGRVLAGVSERPGVTLDSLVRTTYLGERDAEDAVADLCARSCLVREPGGGLALTEEGRRVREAVRRRWEAFQADQVVGLSETDLAAARRVLATLIARNTPAE